MNTPTHTAAVQQGAHRVARYAAIALGASLPVSTALDNILLVVILLGWLIGGRYQEKFALIRSNPVAIAALAMFAVVVAGLAWGNGPLADGMLYLKKYTSLIVIPLLLPLFTDPRDRYYALLALAGSLALSLIFSYELWMDWIPVMPPIVGTPDDPSTFKLHIDYSIIMAFGALLFAELARDAKSAWPRLIWGLLSAAAVVNVMLLVKGRTGYILVAAFAMLFLFQLLRWRGAVAAFVLVVVGFGSIYQLSANFQERMKLIVTETHAWKPGVAEQTSVGGRLEFYWTAISIIRDHPLQGVGTAGFAKAYREKVKDTDITPTRNPHNIYLLVTAQFGVLGVAALLFLCVQQWRYAGRLSVPGHAMLARATVLTLVLGGLFNSMIIDHMEGLMFAWLSGVLFAGLADPGAGKSA